MKQFVRRASALIFASLALISCGQEKGIQPIEQFGDIEVFSVPNGADIYLDDTFTGKQTPDTLTDISVGKHLLILVAANYHVWRDSIDVLPDTLSSVRAELQRQTTKLSVVSSPNGAKIFINGNPTGEQTPCEFIDFGFGQYQISLKLPDYQDWDSTLFVFGPTQVQAVLSPLCDNIVGDPTKNPEISIIDLHEDDQSISGNANNIDTSQVRVVLWAKTDRWYIQPSVINPYTYIDCQGHWQNWTHAWLRITALLVDDTYQPGDILDTHPASAPGVLAWDEYPSPSGDRYLNFSDFYWRVKNGDLMGPGPNYFSDNQENVWLETDGLHLKTVFRDGNWYCSEVILDHSLGFGQYTVQLASRVDSLDPNITFSPFVYEDWDREIDIEFSLALVQPPNNAQYVVHPWYEPGNLVQFFMPNVIQSSHRMVWQSDKIEFYSWTGYDPEPSPSTLIFSWTYTGPDIPPPGGERMRMNLWLLDGNPPATGESNEVIIKSFTYVP